MASTINASNGEVSGLITTGDASGQLQLQVNNGTPAVTLNTSGAVGVGSSPSYGTSGQVLTSAGSGSAPTWSTVEALPSQTGNSGKYLTTNGTVASWGTSAGGVLEAVASGTLDNGATVVVNSDGTVSAVVNSSGATTSIPATNSPKYLSAAIDNTNNKIVLCYVISSTLYAIAGTISNSTITFGSETWISSLDSSSNPSNGSVTFDTVNQKFVIFYCYSGLQGTVLTVTGTSISTNGAYTISASGTPWYAYASYNPSAQKIVVAWFDAGPSQNKVISCSVSGTAITYGNYTNFGVGSGKPNFLIYDPTSQKMVYVYKADTTLTSRTVTLSGVDCNLGSSTTVGSANDPFYCCVDTVNNQIVYLFSDSGNNNYPTTRLATISGTSITTGNTYVVSSSGASADLTCIFNPSTSKVEFIYGKNSGGTWLKIGTISSGSMTFNSESQLSSDYSQSPTYQGISLYSSSFTKSIHSFAQQSYSLVYFFINSAVTPNLTANNFIGISNGSYTNGQTATIQIIGSVNNSQSGLTAGQKYYVTRYGTLSTTADTISVVAGTAVSATKLIIKG